MNDYFTIKNKRIKDALLSAMSRRRQFIGRSTVKSPANATTNSHSAETWKPDVQATDHSSMKTCYPPDSCVAPLRGEQKARVETRMRSSNVLDQHCWCQLVCSGLSEVCWVPCPRITNALFMLVYISASTIPVTTYRLAPLFDPPVPSAIFQLIHGVSSRLEKQGLFDWKYHTMREHLWPAQITRHRDTIPSKLSDVWSRSTVIARHQMSSKS